MSAVRLAFSSYMPSESEIMAIPLARSGEYHCNDKDAKTIRSRIYAINKHNAANRRYRTLRENGALLVWRIR